MSAPTLGNVVADLYFRDRENRKLLEGLGNETVIHREIEDTLHLMLTTMATSPPFAVSFGSEEQRSKLTNALSTLRSLLEELPPADKRVPLL